MHTDTVWKNCLIDIEDKGALVNPRNQWVRELIGYQYQIDMNAPIISLESRKMNYSFMFAEAAWICSGSNWLDDLTPFMKRYADFSDDKVFLNGAYGVKVAEQVSYVVNTLAYDRNSRQAVLNIWRERPGLSKDIPCTTTMQFLIRDGKLNMVTTMRSQDAVLGFSYDVFTFSSVALLVRNLLSHVHGIDCDLGTLTVTAGSFHVYEEHFDRISEWTHDVALDRRYNDVLNSWEELANYADEPRGYINELWSLAHDYS